jgi:hypothetical protein
MNYAAIHEGFGVEATCLHKCVCVRAWSKKLQITCEHVCKMRDILLLMCMQEVYVSALQPERFR